MSIRQYWFVLWELTKRELKRKYAILPSQRPVL